MASLDPHIPSGQTAWDLRTHGLHLQSTILQQLGLIDCGCGSEAVPTAQG